MLPVGLWRIVFIVMHDLRGEDTFGVWHGKVISIRAVENYASCHRVHRQAASYHDARHYYSNVFVWRCAIMGWPLLL